MTVVAYRAGILAADSRCSDEYSMHLTNCRKIFRLKNGALLGTAGDDDARLLMKLLSSATPRNMPSRQALAETKTGFHGIMVFPKGQVFVVGVGYASYTDSDGEWDGWVSPITDEFVAVGHGQQYAYGVMEHGGTAIEAVRCACKRDTTCALPLQWESIDGRNKSVPQDPPTKKATVRGNR